MNLIYEKCGDYLIPNLIPDPEPEGELRKFGLMRKSYLENHRRGIYSGLLLSGELKKHLLMIQEQAGERFDLLVEQMVLFCTLDDAFPVRLNDGVPTRIRMVYANYFRLIAQFI